jgi:hypothetical protein
VGFVLASLNRWRCAAALALALSLIPALPAVEESSRPDAADSSPPADQLSLGDSPQEEGGMELPLLEEKQPKKKKVKKKKVVKKTHYPYEKYELKAGMDYGWNDNVFQSSDIYIPKTGERLKPQGDQFRRPKLSFSWDKYLSKIDKFSLDYDYSGKFYNDLSLEDKEHHTLRLEWRKKVADKSYVTVGAREKRRLNAPTDRFGKKLKSDLDYYRTDLYAEYEWQLIKDHTLNLEYRFVNKDYDEYPGPNVQSIDWREHRLRAELVRDYGFKVKAKAWYERRWRDYPEKLARNFEGTKISSVERSLMRDLAGVRIERPLSKTIFFGMEIEYDQVTDPYQGYYSYHGINYRADLEWQISEKWKVEIDGKLYQRDYDKRKFLASRVANPIPPPTHLDPFIDLYEDYRFKVLLTYACTDRLELTGGYYYRWYHVNDPTEEFRENQIYFGVSYAFRGRIPPKK